MKKSELTMHKLLEEHVWSPTSVSWNQEEEDYIRIETQICDICKLVRKNKYPLKKNKYPSLISSGRGEGWGAWKEKLIMFPKNSLSES